MTTLTAMPASCSAGTTLTYERSVPELPTTATSWKLCVYLAGASEAKHENIVAASNVWTVLISATTMAALPPGAYRWVERVKETSPGTRVFDIGSGALMVEPDLAAATAGSALSFESQVLAALKDKFLGRLTVDQETLQIEGTAVARIPFEQLEGLITKYQRLVDLQESPNAAIGSIEIHFGGAR